MAVAVVNEETVGRSVFKSRGFCYGADENVWSEPQNNKVTLKLLMMS